ncbi:MAG: RnfABCDGE type electron transport complex subunit B [Rhodocyclaceae bacterium]|jgi:electron transport complex protein RnfB|nr:RnfABCDGE type electron transport complex subunit B [Rhodocyclaceae bacterium]MCE2979417.1 RnfABCDGE type electron transport complex subunit B [Betaproteobacteria bacterium]MCA3076753.1 RnfABCDGE type electron transport complex subunit B [Rhodocyclaceae bacterium]MCA3088772.1 RnfABCDGE type electron transport complex subunit B [Rhodocyclaceae bacterium]MCA3092444.1 RnfABCDGE type electron transport complex subunit B [Rhodocyclaceae bacterium]
MTEPVQRHAALQVALVDEAACIGCTICMQKCPVDAIVGASRQMHTVLSAECIGCRLCIAPCPVDCITMVDRPAGQARPDPALVRERHRFRQRRLAREPAERAARFAEKARMKLAGLAAEPAGTDTGRRRAVVERALARARERLACAGLPEGK